MKHFLVEITYTASLAKIDAVLSEHRTFLQEGYDKGILLCSGPRKPRTGGVILARAVDLADVEAYFAKDPFVMHSLAEYRYHEFEPVKYQPWLTSWINGT